jgi:hypothetical protein
LIVTAGAIAPAFSEAFMKINTKGRPFIAGGSVYRADRSGYVDIPDDVLRADGYPNIPAAEPLNDTSYLDDMTKRELLDLCEQLKITVDARSRNDTIRDAIRDWYEDTTDGLND